MVQDARRHSSRPVIGVTGNARRFSPSWFFIRLSVWLSGGRAVRISTRHGYDVHLLDGIIISGGDDIHPSLYTDSEPMPAAHYDPDRDALEQEYIQHAFDESVPILGICRGYQLINVTAGGTLHLDIRGMREKTSNWGTVLPRKTAKVEKDSELFGLLQAERTRINSLHSQAVKDVAEGYQVTARDMDGFIQAIEHIEGLPVLGVQWHPEYLFYLSRQRRLFGWLMDCARNSQS